MNEEKLSENKISVKQNKFLKWLDNYWYHYKWPTIVVAFFVVVFSVCLIQSWTNDEKDILVTYAGPTALEADERLDIERVLSENLPEGFGNKGTDGAAGLIPYIIYSKDQIVDMHRKEMYVDAEFNSKEYSTLNSQYKTGNGSIYMLERWLYDELIASDTKAERLKPLKEIFGYVPECAIDEYGIRLGDTELYKNSPELQVLPADTVIFLHEQIFGQKKYEKQIEAFKKFALPAAKEVTE